MAFASGPTLVIVSAVLYAVGNVFNKSCYRRGLSQVTVFLFRAVLCYLLNASIAQLSGAQSAASVLLLRTPTRRSAVLAFLRGCAGFGQVMLLNLSFDLAISFADAFAIKEALGTLMTLAVARLVLGADEQLHLREKAGVAAVLAGLLLIAQPPSIFGPMSFKGAALAAKPLASATLPRWAGFVMLVFGAAFQGVQNVLTRMLSKSGSALAVTPATLLSYYMVALGLCSSVASLFAHTYRHPYGHGSTKRNWAWARLTPPSAWVDWVLLVAIVVVGTFGQLAVASGARTTTASKVALLAINELAFAYVLGVTVLNEPTSVLSTIGTAVVFAGSALVAAGPDAELPCTSSRTAASPAEPTRSEDAGLLKVCEEDDVPP